MKQQHYKQLLPLLVLLSALLHYTLALTAQEQGDVITIDGVQCRFCLLDCHQTNLLRNCKTQYFQYGCHINQYCLTVNTATAREFFAGLALCVYRNGCELVSSDEKTLLGATSEGQLELQVMDFVATQKNAAIVSNSNTNMFKLQSEVYTMYLDKLTTIENTWINNANKLTEGKRRAFQLINISPSFFILQELMQSMFNDADKWKETCDHADFDTLPQTSTMNFIAPIMNDAKTDALLSECTWFAKVLDNDFHGNETMFIQAKMTRSQCRKRAMYLYVYRNLCKLPKTFLQLIKIADSLVNDKRELMSERLYGDFASNSWYYLPVNINGRWVAKTIFTDIPKIRTIYNAIHDFAFNYVEIMESTMDPNTKKNKIDTITKDIKSIAGICDDMYCTYLCKDYAYDIAAKYCDVYDESIDLIRGIMTGYCSLPDINNGMPSSFLMTADLSPVELREASTPELKYCKASQRTVGRTTQQLCAYLAMQATGNMYYGNWVMEGRGFVGQRMIPVSIVHSNDIDIPAEPLTQEIDYFYAKYGDCTKTKCSRANGCDILASDLTEPALKQHYDKKANWFIDTFNQHISGWRKMMSTFPKMMFAKGSDEAAWFRSFNLLDGQWTAWSSLGERLKASPAAVSLGGNKAMLVAWTSDNALKYRLVDNNQWSAWSSLSGVVFDRPAIASTGGRIIVFVVGTSRVMYARIYDGTSWSDYINIGGRCVGAAPSAVAWGTSKIVVFIREADTTVAYKVFDIATNMFGPWINIKGNIIGSVSTVMLGDGRLMSLVRGSNNGLWYNINQNSVWLPTSWVPLGGILTSSPAAVVFGALEDKVMVFVRGTDSALHYRLFENNVWKEWTSLQGILTSEITAVALDPSRVAVFVRGTDAAVHYRIYYSFNGQWSSWTSIGGVVVGEQAAIAM